MRAFFLSLLLFFAAATPASAAIKITVDISDQTMTVDTGSYFSSYRWKVSTARPGYVTPPGSYKPYLLKKMHYSAKYDNAPMPNSVFFHGGYAIHATNFVKSLGRPASHGCVRLDPRNAAKLYDLIHHAGMAETSIRIIP